MTTFLRSRPARLAGRRRLGFEHLEGRAFFAGMGSAAHVVEQPVAEPLTEPSAFNSVLPGDVDRDGRVSTRDALAIINELLASGPRVISSPPLVGDKLLFIDVVPDGRVNSRDLLQVFNILIAPRAIRQEDPAQLTPRDVEELLKRASAASESKDAIIAIVDRSGRILGVRLEDDVVSAIPDTDIAKRVFAVDGAVAKARTAAFFANNMAPLTSRTVRYISQSTITQREVESNPNIADPNSTLRGPGFVAPIGLGGHFPPQVANTPLVDLFGIEHTNRDGIIHPGYDGIRGTADDQPLSKRFNIDPHYMPAGVELPPPESYGFASGYLPNAQSRGIATLPGGIPIYKHGSLVGGIGVFFPGPDGYATHEQGFVAGRDQSELDRTNAPKVLEAEWIAFAAVGGSSGFNASVGPISGVQPLPGFDLPDGRIDLVGLTLELFAPRPNKTPRPLVAGAVNGTDLPVDPGADGEPGSAADNVYYGHGRAVPEGWLVTPHGSGAITAEDVENIIMAGVDEAKRTRAQIRELGQRTSMVFAVADPDGNVLGLFRMEDATVFSIDVAVAKARNTVYYADASAIQPIDQVDDNGDGVPDVPAGAAFSNRTFRFLAAPRFPTGAPEGTLSGAFSILRDPGINSLNAENVGPPLPASAYTSVLGFDAFNPGRNFRDQGNIKNQNGIVFFPGSAPLYKGNTLIAGFGVSGDGVDQDDFVTFAGQQGFEIPDAILRADEIFVRGVRLPYQKFPRNPRG